MQAANAPLLRTAELASVRGASANAWAALARCRVAAGDSVNINTADGDAIAAALPDLAGEKLAAFVASAREAAQRWRSCASASPGRAVPEGASFGFSSGFFLVSVRSRGRCDRPARALLKRDGQRTARGGAGRTLFE